MPEQEQIKVSVCVITYNQQDFISQTLDSILMQKTDFPVEIVIGNDNSTDGTGKICSDYAEKFPERIKYFHREKNLGMMPNFIETLEACTGKYIAICEGDDFWTDETKLQTQFDFMETNPEVSLCCHNHSVLVKNNIIPLNENITDDTEILQTEDYMMNPFFHTSSYFFRSDAQPKPYPEWYKNVLAGDHFLVLLLSLKGKIGYIHKRMSVFRNHGTSVSFTRKPREIKQNFVYHLDIFNQYSNLKYQKPINHVVSKWELIYQVYEPVGYFKKMAYLFRNLGFYTRNFKEVGGVKLLLKYILPASVIKPLKS